MATFTTTPGNAVAIAQRLLKANVPFDLRVGESGTIDCQFEETLNLAVYQQELAILRNGGVVTRKHTDPYGTPTGRIVKPFEPEMHRLPITGSMKYPQHQQIPRGPVNSVEPGKRVPVALNAAAEQFFIDLPSGTEQVHCTSPSTCPKCNGRKGSWLAGASAHPDNWYICEECKGRGEVLVGKLSPTHRFPASIGTDASCPMTDTEFDSDPSVVME